MAGDDRRVTRVALVTGAGSGIGRASALALAEAGYFVVLAGRRAGALAETAGLTNTDRTLCVVTDVADDGAVRVLFGRVEAELGRLDLLFNNAGYNPPFLALEDLPVAEMRRTIDVNLIGAMLCAGEAMRLMKKQAPQGGRIINAGSLSAHMPRPLTAVYSASKHAMTGLTKAILMDGRAFGIAGSQIDIGNAATDMSDHMASGALQANGRLKPEPRISADEVARMVVHIAGLPPEANVPFVTLMASGMPFYGRG